MLRTTMLCVAVLLAVVTVAVADITMATPPAMDWDQVEGDASPTVELIYEAEAESGYTITDHDTFTSSAPPPPQPPYGQGLHDDTVWVSDGLTLTAEYPEGIISYVGAGSGGHVHNATYDLWVGNRNQAGEPGAAQLVVEWDDDALGPIIYIPPGQLHGTANDDPVTFGKNFYLYPE